MQRRYLSSKLKEPLNGFQIEKIIELSKEFAHLTENKEYCTYSQFNKWNELTELLTDELITLEEINKIWSEVIQNEMNLMTFEDFLKVNKLLDEMYESDDDSTPPIDTLDPPTVLTNLPTVQTNSTQLTLSKGTNVWNRDISTDQLFEKEFIHYLTDFFHQHCNDKKLLNYILFANWMDVKQLIRDGNVDETCLLEIWKEAMEYKHGVETLHNFNMKDLESNERWMVDLDGFLRVNARLEKVLMDVAQTWVVLSQHEQEVELRRIFHHLVSPSSIVKLLTWDQLKGSSYLQNLMDTLNTSLDHVETVWNAIPKEIIPHQSFYTKLGKQYLYGINEESFIVFIRAIEMNSS